MVGNVGPLGGANTATPSTNKWTSENAIKEYIVSGGLAILGIGAFLRYMKGPSLVAKCLMMGGGVASLVTIINHAYGSADKPISQDLVLDESNMMFDFGRESLIREEFIEKLKCLSPTSTTEDRKKIIDEYKNNDIVTWLKDYATNEDSLLTEQRPELSDEVPGSRASSIRVLSNSVTNALSCLEDIGSKESTDALNEIVRGEAVHIDVRTLAAQVLIKKGNFESLFKLLGQGDSLIQNKILGLLAEVKNPEVDRALIACFKNVENLTPNVAEILVNRCLGARGLADSGHMQSIIQTLQSYLLTGADGVTHSAIVQSLSDLQVTNDNIHVLKEFKTSIENLLSAGTISYGKKLEISRNLQRLTTKLDEYDSQPRKVTVKRGDLGGEKPEIRVAVDPQGRLKLVSIHEEDAVKDIIPLLHKTDVPEEERIAEAKKLASHDFGMVALAECLHLDKPTSVRLIASIALGSILSKRINSPRENDSNEELLGKAMCVRESVKILKEYLQSGDSRTRTLAASGLSQIDTEDATNSLAYYIKGKLIVINKNHRTNLERMSAARELAGFKAGVEVLAGCLKSDNLSVRLIAANVLGEVNSLDAARPLLSYVSERIQKIKNASLPFSTEVLSEARELAGSQIGTCALAECLQENMPEPARLLAAIGLSSRKSEKISSPNFFDRNTVLLQDAMCLRESVKVLKSLLESDSVEIRKQAARTLSGIETSDASSSYTAYIDNRLETINQTAQTLPKMLSIAKEIVTFDRGRDGLVKLLQDERPQVQLIAASALVNIPERTNECITILSRLVSHSDFEIVRAASSALGSVSIGGADVSEPGGELQTKLVSGRNTKARARTVEALGELKDFDSVFTLIKSLKSDKNDVVRKQSAIALGKIGVSIVSNPLIMEREKETLVVLEEALTLIVNDKDFETNAQVQQAAKQALRDIDKAKVATAA